VDSYRFTVKKIKGKGRVEINIQNVPNLTGIMYQELFIYSQSKEFLNKTPTVPVNI
jgi:hypothetical protein